MNMNPMGMGMPMGMGGSNGMGSSGGSSSLSQRMAALAMGGGGMGSNVTSMEAAGERGPPGAHGGSGKQTDPWSG